MLMGLNFPQKIKCIYGLSDDIFGRFRSLFFFMMMLMMALMVLESLNVPGRTVWGLKWVRGGN